IAVLTLALLGSGVKLFEAALLANLAAGVVVGKRGTATVSGDEIMAYYQNSRPRVDAPRS
ncbi:MAG: bifunctional heptose 7-phosphate kinase/heptose 1-phosphate adenyltransferase, partial [Deltaproteobacteria bacterium]|nr:bifunctional heptose 7-phosphate kinase/heptose 1-phosphate adenyltransferase [Deltaproteobacteria bacterium]